MAITLSILGGFASLSLLQSFCTDPEADHNRPSTCHMDSISNSKMFNALTGTRHQNVYYLVHVVHLTYTNRSYFSALRDYYLG